MLGQNEKKKAIESIIHLIWFESNTRNVTFHYLQKYALLHSDHNILHFVTMKIQCRYTSVQSTNFTISKLQICTI